MIRDNLMNKFFLMNLYTYKDTLILDDKILRDQFDLNMGISIGRKGIGLVAAQKMIEAYSRMMNGYALNPLYTHA